MPFCLNFALTLIVKGRKAVGVLGRLLGLRLYP